MARAHCPFKQAVSAALASIDLERATEQGRRWARVLADRYLLKPAPEQLADFAFRLPAYVVGSLLGVPPDMLERLTRLVGDFVGCLAPNSSAVQLERGGRAAAQLLDSFRSLLAKQQDRADGGLLATLAHEARRVGRDATDTIIANRIGFLSQAYEATAGLIGNTGLALAAHTEVRRMVAAEPSLLNDVVLEVLRYDPPDPEHAPVSGPGCDDRGPGHARRRRGAGAAGGGEPRPAAQPPPRALRHTQERSAQLHLWPWPARLPRRGAGPRHRPGRRRAADRRRRGLGAGRGQLPRLGERAIPIVELGS